MANPIIQARGGLTEEQVKAFLSKFGVEKFTINADGLVDIDGSIYLDGLREKTLPIHFGVVHGDFVANGGELESLVGSPTKVEGNYYVHHNDLKSLVGMPHEVVGNICVDENPEISSLEGLTPLIAGDLFICNLPKVHSLHGINDMIQKIGYSPLGKGTIGMEGTPIDEDVLGLLFIDGLTAVEMTNKELAKIINKYLEADEKDKDIHQAQEEMIDAGFGKEAKL